MTLSLLPFVWCLQCMLVASECLVRTPSVVRGGIWVAWDNPGGLAGVSEAEVQVSGDGSEGDDTSGGGGGDKIDDNGFWTVILVEMLVLVMTMAVLSCTTQSSRSCASISRSNKIKKIHTLWASWKVYRDCRTWLNNYVSTLEGKILQRSQDTSFTLTQA